MNKSSSPLRNAVLNFALVRLSGDETEHFLINFHTVSTKGEVRRGFSNANIFVKLLYNYFSLGADDEVIICFSCVWF